MHIQSDIYPTVTKEALVQALQRGDVGEFNALHKQWRGQNPNRKLDLRRTAITSKDLVGIDLSNTILDEVSFEGVNLESARFYEASLKFANFNHAALRNAKLQNANLESAELVGADLSLTFAEGAQFTLAILDRAKFHSAELKDCRFKRASMQHCDLSGANLLRADFRYTDFTDIIIRDSLEDSISSRTKFCSGTIFQCVRNADKAQHLPIPIREAIEASQAVERALSLQSQGPHTARAVARDRNSEAYRS